MLEILILGMVVCFSIASSSSGNLLSSGFLVLLAPRAMRFTHVKTISFPPWASISFISSIMSSSALLRWGHLLSTVRQKEQWLSQPFWIMMKCFVRIGRCPMLWCVALSGLWGVSPNNSIHSLYGDNSGYMEKKSVLEISFPCCSVPHQVIATCIQLFRAFSASLIRLLFALSVTTQVAMRRVFLRSLFLCW